MKLLHRLLAPLLALCFALAPAGAATLGQKAIVLSGVQGWSLPGSSADLYFSRNAGSCAILRIAKPCSSILTTTRASTGYAQWADGHFSSFAANVPRITDLGDTIEPASTNGIRNNSMGGASAGTPGVLPTNWQTQATLNGINRTVVGTGTEFGLPYVDVTFAGTPTSSFTQQITVDTSTGIPALTAQTWTHSFYARLSAGSVTNLGVLTAGINEETSAGGFVSGGNATGALLTASMARFLYTRTLNGGATVANAQPLINVSFTNALAVNATIRIYAPQLEQLGVATTPILTITVAVTRAADSAVIKLGNVTRIVFTFSDATTQTISGITPNANYTIPTNLNKPIIARMTGYPA